jgi:uncharacterized protein YbjT (DUF2867 family)
MFVIAGVTGNTGGVVADTLLAQGQKVRVIVRDAAKGEPWKKRGAEVAVAELEDPKGLAAALAGASGAYLLLPPRNAAGDVVAEQRRVADAIAAAVAEANVPHVVLLSSIGAQHEGGTGPIKTLHYAERRLEAATNAKLTFVRAAYFLENWGAVAAATKGGKLPTFIRPDFAIPMVATRDIGRVAACALAEGPPAKRIDIVELAGPEDWSPNDIARAFAKVVGRDVEPEAAPFEAVVPAFTSFGLSKSVAENFEEMYRGIANGQVDWQGSGARLVRGEVDAASIAKALVG